MTPRTMLIFTLREREGWSIATIARVLGHSTRFVEHELSKVNQRTDGGKERVSA